MSDHKATIRAAYIGAIALIIATLMTIFQDELKAWINGDPEHIKKLVEKDPNQTQGSEAKDPLESNPEEEEKENKGQSSNYGDVEIMGSGADLVSPIRGLKIGDTGNFVHDGTRYNWKIMEDGKTWLTTNLAVEVKGKSWYYGDNPSKYKEYGRLYSFEGAKEGCRLLGDGWKLPTDKEWREMAKRYGGVDDDASDEGKAAYEALIQNGNSGFAALLGGRRASPGSYYGLGTSGYYWTSTEGGSKRDYAFHDGKVWRDFSFGQTGGRSVRCLQPAR